MLNDVKLRFLLASLCLVCYGFRSGWDLNLLSGSEKLDNAQLEAQLSASGVLDAPFTVAAHARHVDGNASQEPVAASGVAKGSPAATPALLLYTLVYGEEQWRKPLMKLFIESTRRCEVDLLIIGSPRPPPDLQLPRWLSCRSSHFSRSSYSSHCSHRDNCMSTFLLHWFATACSTV